MMKTIPVLACCTLLLPALAAQGQETSPGGWPKLEAAPTRPMSAGAFRKLQVPGDVVAKRVKKLTTELPWYKTLGGARAAGSAKGKPILWIQALGDVDGFL